MYMLLAFTKGHHHVGHLSSGIELALHHTTLTSNHRDKYRSRNLYLLLASTMGPHHVGHLSSGNELALHHTALTTHHRDEYLGIFVPDTCC